MAVMASLLSENCSRIADSRPDCVTRSQADWKPAQQQKNLATVLFEWKVAYRTEDFTLNYPSQQPHHEL